MFNFPVCRSFCTSRTKRMGKANSRSVKWRNRKN